jgi:hypothetical protein
LNGGYFSLAQERGKAFGGRSLVNNFVILKEKQVTFPKHPQNPKGRKPMTKKMGASPVL